MTLKEELLIHHQPLFDVDALEKIYTEREKELVRYVCTTSLFNPDVGCDIFFRETAHPDFGNYYFGVFLDPESGQPMICGADQVEKNVFGMIEWQGEWWYSRYRHDYVSLDDQTFIDGGREYTRFSGKLRSFNLFQGEWYESVDEDNQTLNSVDSIATVRQAQTELLDEMKAWNDHLSS